MKWCNNENDWYKLVVVRDGEEPHRHSARDPEKENWNYGDDERSLWAYVNRRLRERQATCSLSEHVMDEVEKIKGWNWREPPCTCDGCLRDRDEQCARFLYTEVLTRAEPWYDEEDDDKMDHLYALAAKHWSAFFGPLQKYVGECFEANVKRWPLGVEFRDWKHVRDGLNKDIPECFVKNRDGENFEVTRELYEVLAALNEARRKRDCPPSLSECEPKFEHEHIAQGGWFGPERFNFEGTAEDNYCLGSKGHAAARGECASGGCKYYVGTTNDKGRRHREHEDTALNGASRGSRYIYDMGARGEPDAFGGWKLATRVGKQAMHVTEGRHTTLHEDQRTEELLFKYGLNHVRGGVYVMSMEILHLGLQIKWRQYRNLCFKCGKDDHKSKDCRERDGIITDENCRRVAKVCFRYRRDDPAIQAFSKMKRGKRDDRDNRDGAPITRICECAKNMLRICARHSRTTAARLLLTHVEHKGEEDDVRSRDEVDEFLESIEYATELTLREKQREAIKHILDKDRPDVTLAVPTAYGKTTVFLAAAIHEVVHGNGKVVIWLPYTALMSEIADTFAEMADRDFDLNRDFCEQYGEQENGEQINMRGLVGQVVQRTRVETNEAYCDVKETRSAYGGTFYVKDPTVQRTTQRCIKWTVWRGARHDAFMREHQQSDIFKSADIILATPDKWLWPDKENRGCDSFVSTFEKEDLLKIGLLVIDEAHQMQDVFGANVRESIKRMRNIHKALHDADAIRRNNEGYKRFRVLLSSATLNKPREFTDNLLGRRDAKIVQLQEATKYRSKPFTQKYRKVRIDPHDSIQDELEVEAATDHSESDDSAGESDSDYSRAAQKGDAIIDKVCGQGEDSPSWIIENWERRQQRLVLLLDGKIEPNILMTKMLDPDVIRPGIRRCLIFVDSKSTANLLMKLARGLARRWSEKGKVLYATPYHGDCATHHRRVYEKLFREWVQQESEAPQPLHVIIATSALEAGVNIRGCDLIFILDAKMCSCASLTQRIGRGGREPGQPALIVVGVHDEDQRAETKEDISDGEDTEEEVDDDCEKVRMLLHDPARYLSEVNKQINLTDSEAIKLNGALQEIRDKIQLKLVPHESQQHTIQELMEKIRIEIPVLSMGNNTDYINLPTRGISSTAVSLRLCDEHGNSLVGRHGAPVEIAKIDSVKCLDCAHPFAQSLDPHGKIIIAAFGCHVRRKCTTDLENSWLERLYAVDVSYMADKHGKAYSVFDGYNHRGTTKSEWTETICFDHSFDRIPPRLGNVKLGVVTVLREWKGYRFAYGGATIETTRQLVFENARYSHREQEAFFNPAEHKTSGWVCRFSMAMLPTTSDEADGCLVLATLLQCWAADILSCSTQHIRTDVKKIHIDETAAKVNYFELIVYETAQTGLASQLARRCLEGWLERWLTPSCEFPGPEYFHGKYLNRKLWQMIKDSRFEDTEVFVRTALEALRSAVGTRGSGMQEQE